MNAVLTAVTTAVPGVASLPYVSSSGQLGSSGITVGPSGSPGFVAGPTVSSGFLGLGSIIGLLAGIVVVMVVLAVLGVLVIVVVANRAEPDSTGRRPQSVYFFAISFVTLVLSVIGSAAVVTALVQLIGSHRHAIGNSVARTAVLAGLITVVSVVLLVVHLRRALALARAGAELTSPSRRVGQSYVSVVAFIAVLLLLSTTVLAIYLVFVLAGPGVFGTFGGRVPALRYLIDTVYVGVVAAVILLTHRNLVPPGLRFWGQGEGAGQMPGQPEPSAEPSAEPSPPAE